jgi:hypothetical protein
MKADIPTLHKEDILILRLHELKSGGGIPAFQVNSAFGLKDGIQ